jgi:hypothetical protein
MINNEAFEKLNNLLAVGAITQDEYDTQLALLLDSMHDDTSVDQQQVSYSDDNAPKAPKHRLTGKTIRVIVIIAICIVIGVMLLIILPPRMEIWSVENTINSIGEVTLEDRETIQLAEDAYSKLDEEKKQQVRNYDLIGEAKDALTVLETEALISDIGEIDLDSDSAITSAQYSFDKLPDELKNAVKNQDILNKAKSEYSILKMIADIDNLDPVSLTNRDISTLHYTYLKMTDDEKSRITNSKILLDAMSEYDRLLDEDKARKVAEVEQQKQAEIDAKQAEIDALKASIKIRAWNGTPDFLGGFYVYVNYTNLTEKTIKYANFEVAFYNAVGDQIENEYHIGGGMTEGLSDTGPFGSGEGRSGTYWRWGTFYNSTISVTKLVSAKIEYTDGTFLNISSSEIEYVVY